MERLLRSLIDEPSVPCPPCLRRGPRPNRPDAAARTLAALLDPDPPLARRLMAIARPYGARSNLIDAIGRLGVSRARLLIDALCWRERLGTPDTPHASIDAVAMDPDLVQLWRHSVACAHAAHALAQFTGRVAPDDAWRMGLLHDIGARCAIERWSAPPSAAADLSGLRRVVMARLRGRLALRTLRGWEVPAAVTVAIAHHDRSGHGDADVVVALMRTTHGIADALGYGWGPPLRDTVDLDAARCRLDLAQTTVDQIRMAVQPRIEAMLAELSLVR